jgi:hypothetical protein
MTQEQHPESGVSNKLFAVYCGLLFCYMAWQIYQSKQAPPDFFSNMPIDPNKEIRQEYERRAMERQMQEWDEHPV